MPVTEYQKDGITFYKIRVDLVSRKIAGLRIQRVREAIKTEKQACDLEQQLFKQAVKELTIKEEQGYAWNQVVDAWEVGMRNGLGLTKPILSTTIADSIAVLKNHTHDWMKVPASQITPTMARRLLLIDIPNKGLSYSRAKALKYSIQQAFTFGLDSRMIPGNLRSPVEGIALKKELVVREPEILNINQVRELLRLAKQEDHEFYPVWLLAFMTGMRSGELYALEWSDMDWENKMITVSKSYNKRLKGNKSTKNGDWRRVPINAELFNFLSERRRSHPNDLHILPRLEKWERGEAAKPLREFCEAHGLPSIRLHTTRACFATMMLQAGSPALVVRKIGGWKEEKVMNRYIRLAGVDVSGATEAISTVLC